MTINEVLELGTAILGVQGSNMVLVKDGKPLLLALGSLSQAGVVNGDLLVDHVLPPL